MWDGAKKCGRRGGVVEGELGLLPVDPDLRVGRPGRRGADVGVGVGDGEVEAGRRAQRMEDEGWLDLALRYRRRQTGSPLKRCELPSCLFHDEQRGNETDRLRTSAYIGSK